MSKNNLDKYLSHYMVQKYNSVENLIDDNKYYRLPLTDMYNHTFNIKYRDPLPPENQ